MKLSTIGHSTHPIEEFIHILQAHGITRLVDVRTIPKSRHNPQFNRENLAASLQSAGIDYRHLPGLGGLRHPRKDSINTAWRNASFRGYADYMQTPEFEENLQKLLEIASDVSTAIMCAEAVPWRCHRSLIADVLLARGIPVEEILSTTKSQLHTMTPFAKVDGQRVTYPKGPSDTTTMNLFDASDNPPAIDIRRTNTIASAEPKGRKASRQRDPGPSHHPHRQPAR